MSARDPARPPIGDPTLVCGFPKSGTSLVAALLDGHPDLLCFPEETWALRVVSRYPRDSWLDHVLASPAIRRLGEGVSSGVIGRRDFTGFDLDRMEEVARECWESSERSARDLMESLMEALWQLDERDRCLRWIEKSPEHENHLARHAGDWDGLRVVQVMRDPRSVLCSFRRKREHHAEHVFVDGLIERWRAGLVAVLELEARRPGTVCIVRYEDLVSDVRGEMGRVARAIGVDWHESLLAPTLRGRPWGGNSMFADELVGVSSAPLERWKGELDAAERAVIEACLEVELRALGYSGLDRRRGFAGSVLRAALESRSALRPRLRAMRRMSRLRSERPADVGSDAFSRAFAR